MIWTQQTFWNSGTGVSQKPDVDWSIPYHCIPQSCAANLESHVQSQKASIRIENSLGPACRCCHKTYVPFQLAGLRCQVLERDPDKSDDTQNGYAGLGRYEDVTIYIYILYIYAWLVDECPKLHSLAVPNTLAVIVSSHQRVCLIQYTILWSLNMHAVQTNTRHNMDIQ